MIQLVLNLNYRGSIQGVGMGRVFTFGKLDKYFGALIHAGPGYAQFKTEKILQIEWELYDWYYWSN
jgi:hypothetical protein